MKLEKTNLFILLNDFDQYDWNGLKKFIESPYFNTRDDVKFLFYQLKKFFQGNSSFEKTEEIIRSDAKPFYKPLTEKELRYAVSFLFCLTKDFLAQQQMKNTNSRPGYHLIKSLRQRNQYDLIQKEISKLEKQFDNTEAFTGERQFDLYHISLEKHALLQQTNRNDSRYLKEASNHLDHLFILEKLRFYAHFLVHESMSKVKHTDVFISFILSYVKENINSLPVQIQVYANACYALSDFENEASYGLFKEKLLAYDSDLSPEQNKECYMVAVNYCIKKLNGGKRQYVDQVFELYQAGLKTKAFEENGYLSRFTYKNINTAALGMGRIEWAENFLNEYKHFLDPRHQEDTYLYNLAILHYKRRDFDKTMEILRFVDFEDLFFNLNARTMLLKIYYEKELWSTLDSHLESFKVFLYRHKELGYQKNHYLRLVKFTNRLLKCYSYNSNRLQSFMVKIKSEKELAEKKWLIEKLEIFF